jgi:hypothetical protein
MQSEKPLYAKKPSEKFKAQLQRGKKTSSKKMLKSGPLTYFFLMIICMKAAYFCDREKSMNTLTDERLALIKLQVQELSTKWAWLPTLQLLIFELIGYSWGDGSIIGAAQSAGLVLLWASNEALPLRHDIAKAIYIVSLIRLLYALVAHFWHQLPQTSYLQVFLTILKPLLLVSGSDSQLPITLCLFQFLALCAFLRCYKK